jgi:hypothetical protein
VDRSARHHRPNKPLSVAFLPPHTIRSWVAPSSLVLLSGLEYGKSNFEWANLFVRVLIFSLRQDTLLTVFDHDQGTTGKTPNGSGGVTPSVTPPFGVTRRVAQTQVSYVSAMLCNALWGPESGGQVNHRVFLIHWVEILTVHGQEVIKIHGFMVNRQPVLWMGEPRVQKHRRCSCGVGVWAQVIWP